MARKGAKRRAQRKPRRAAPKRRPAARALKPVVRRAKPKKKAPARRAPKPKPRPKTPQVYVAAVPEPAEMTPAPPPEPAAPPVVEAVPGTAEWSALDESVRRIESAYSLTFESVHKRLDTMEMRGRPFGDILGAVVRLTGAPEFYAWMLVRSYPGYETDDPDALRLRAYLRARRKR